MESVIYKPYKRSLSEWNNITDRVREDYGGRKIWQVEIGKKIFMDSKTEAILSEESITEDIYLDIIQGIFTNKDTYAAKTTLGYTPQLVISYEGKLVVHNDVMSNYITDILNALKQIDRTLEVKALINTIMCEKMNTKLSADMRKVQKQVNEICNSNYSPLLVGMVLKEFICENERTFTEKQDELHYLSYEDLLDRAGRVLNNKLLGKGKDSFEEDVFTEIFYRFLAGSFSEKV